MMNAEVSNLARSRWASLHWDAILAHATVARAVRAGRLVPEPCAECGAEVSLAHHDDYEQRLDVRWLCDRHHRLWHLAHPLTHVVPAPEPRAKPPAERIPNRGRRFRQYLLPRALRLRDSGASYHEMAQFLGVSSATTHKWIKEYHHAGSAPADD